MKLFSIFFHIVIPIIYIPTIPVEFSQSKSTEKPVLECNGNCFRDWSFFNYRRVSLTHAFQVKHHLNGDGYGGTRGQGCIEFPGGGDTGFLGSVHYLNETLMHLSFKHILLAREGSQINSTPKGGLRRIYSKKGGLRQILPDKGCYLNFFAKPHDFCPNFLS